MKIQELVEFVGNGKNKMLKAAQLEELIAKKIEVKSYLGIKDKKSLIDLIINECILFEDGIFKFDEIDKYICFTMRVIEAYTNLELSADFEDDYDLLCKSGLLEIVINTFKKEYDDVSVLLQMKCDYVLSDNHLSAQVGKFLSSLSDNLGSLSDNLLNKVEGLNLDKLNIKPDVMQKLMELMNK